MVQEIAKKLITYGEKRKKPRISISSLEKEEYRVMRVGD